MTRVIVAKLQCRAGVWVWGGYPAALQFVREVAQLYFT